jgi:hypothetical protein
LETQDAVQGCGKGNHVQTYAEHMKYAAPHPDQIALARNVWHCTHSYAKSILRRGFRYPLQVPENDLAAIKLLLKGLDDPVTAWVSPYYLTWTGYNHTIWFKDAEIFTYVKMMI